MSKVTMIDRNERETVETINADPFIAMGFVCRLKNISLNINKLIKTNSGYEYQLSNGTVLIAENS